MVEKKSVINPMRKKIAVQIEIITANAVRRKK
jgi:hypothetical protein